MISVQYCHLEKPQNLPYRQFPTCYVVSQAQVETNIMLIWQFDSKLHERRVVILYLRILELPWKTTLIESQSKYKYQTFLVQHHLIFVDLFYDLLSYKEVGDELFFLPFLCLLLWLSLC